MGFKFKRSDNIGNIAVGFGILFTGLMNMTSAVSAFSESGIRVFQNEEIVPTPFLSYAVREIRASAGIMITASHNPKEYNGLKVSRKDALPKPKKNDKSQINN